MKKSHWIGSLFTGATALVMVAPAWAQDPRITFPTEGQDVRGEITIRYEGVPDGGYAMVYIDPDTTEGRAPLTATAENSFVLNTFLDAINRVRLGDGPHKVRVVTVNAAGRRVGQAETNFNIANSKVNTDAEGVKLIHWTVRDRIANEVKRYRIFAESNATIEEPDSGGGGGGSSSGGGESSGGGGSSDQGEDAPLDYQISALVRQTVRDVEMVDGSANIKTVVDRAFERQREGEGGGGGGEGGGSGSGGSSSSSKSKGPGKAPWDPKWVVAQEAGKYYVKMIQPSGVEINATRKQPTIALGDLLPTFPQGEVRPGSTWETSMTMIGELAERTPINIRNAPITFTSREDLKTPDGVDINCAKLESRFSLPADQATATAKILAGRIGTSGGGSGGGGEGGGSGSSSGGSGGGESGGETAEVEVKNARARVSRVLWFDTEHNQVLRSEDIVDVYFEQEGSGGGEAGGSGASGGRGGGSGSGSSGRGGGSYGSGSYGSGSYGSGGGGIGGEGGSAEPAEPTKINYNQRITTWLDDRVPPPTDQYNGGAGTAHSRDSVTETSLDPVRNRK